MTQFEFRADFSRRAAAECGPWREPWGKDGRVQSNPARGDRVVAPHLLLLSPTSGAHAFEIDGNPTAYAVGHILSGRRPLASSSTEISHDAACVVPRD